MEGWLRRDDTVVGEMPKGSPSVEKEGVKGVHLVKRLLREKKWGPGEVVAPQWAAKGGWCVMLQTLGTGP
jgi:hypothetical protein